MKHDKSRLDKKIIFSLITAPVLIIVGAIKASAHCPLCVVGAAAAATGAKLLGMTNLALGVLLGGFAMAMGLWTNNLIWNFARRRKWSVSTKVKKIVSSFFITAVSIATIIPMALRFPVNKGLYIFIIGGYGSILNRTYVINEFLITTLIGAGIIIASPYISSWIRKLREGRMIPYQGMIITFFLLIITSVIFQVI